MKSGLLVGLVMATCLVAKTGFAATSVERILGVHYNSEGVTYQVASNGCTSKDSFQVTLRETSPVQVVLERQYEDMCRAFFIYGTEITFSYTELGLTAGEQFVIANPLATAIAGSNN